MVVVSILESIVIFFIIKIGIIYKITYLVFRDFWGLWNLGLYFLEFFGFERISLCVEGIIVLEIEVEKFVRRLDIKI